MFNLLLFFAIGLVGLTHIIVDSKVFSNVRDKIEKANINFLGHTLYDMITCHQCCGFWVGFLGWVFAIPFLPIFLNINWNIYQLIAIPAIAVLSGSAISLLSLFARSLLDWLTLNVQLPESILYDEETTDET